MRFERDAVGARVRLPLPGLEPGTLEVVRVADELVIGVAGRRRKVALPTAFARLEVERVAVRDDELVVSFGPTEGVPVEVAHSEATRGGAP